MLWILENSNRLTKAIRVITLGYNRHIVYRNHCRRRLGAQCIQIDGLAFFHADHKLLTRFREQTPLVVVVEK